MKKQSHAWNINKKHKKSGSNKEHKRLEKYMSGVRQPYEDLHATMETYRQAVKLRVHLAASATETRRQLDSIIAQCVLRLVRIEPQSPRDAHTRYNTLAKCLHDEGFVMPPHARMMIEAALALLSQPGPMPVYH